MNNQKTYTKTLTKSDEGKFIHIPIKIEEGIERIEIHYDYSPLRPKGSAWNNDVDVLVLDEAGKDVGTRGSATRNITISPYYSTPGFDVRKITAGDWSVVVLPARMISSEINFTLSVNTFSKEKKWYRGETHSHTHNSDGALSYRQLIKKAQKLKLDFLCITDHNRTILDMPKSVDYLTLIPGVELTYIHGHTNLWGLQIPYSGTCIVNSYEEYLEKIKEARKNGALISINHPFCSKCGWHWPLDGTIFDCAEVWNGYMRADNLKAIQWWIDELGKNNKISMVGGSDFHRDYYVVPLFAVPTTHVLSKGREAADILEGIKKGRVTITSSRNSTFLELNCGDAVVGDTVKMQNDTKITVSAKKLKRGHTLQLIDKEGVFYSYTAKKKIDYVTEVPIRNEGFAIAQVMYKRKGLGKFLFNIGLKFFMPKEAFTKHPPMVYALCSPIWFEK